MRRFYHWLYSIIPFLLPVAIGLIAIVNAVLWSDMLGEGLPAILCAVLASALLAWPVFRFAMWADRRLGDLLMRK